MFCIGLIGANGPYGADRANGPYGTYGAYGSITLLLDLSGIEGLLVALGIGGVLNIGGGEIVGS